MRQFAAKNFDKEAMNEGDARDFGEPFRNDEPEFIHGKCGQLLEKSSGKRKRYEAPYRCVRVRGEDGASAGASGG
jgi:hypothetical protein